MRYRLTGLYWQVYYSTDSLLRSTSFLYTCNQYNYFIIITSFSCDHCVYELFFIS